MVSTADFLRGHLEIETRVFEALKTPPQNFFEEFTDPFSPSPCPSPNVLYPFAKDERRKVKMSIKDDPDQSTV